MYEMWIYSMCHVGFCYRQLQPCCSWDIRKQSNVWHGWIEMPIVFLVRQKRGRHKDDAVDNSHNLIKFWGNYREMCVWDLDDSSCKEATTSSYIHTSVQVITMSRLLVHCVSFVVNEDELAPLITSLIYLSEPSCRFTSWLDDGQLISFAMDATRMWSCTKDFPYNYPFG